MSGSKRTEQLCRQHIEHFPPLMSKTQKFPDSGGGAPSLGLKKSSGSRSAEQLELPTKKIGEKSAGFPETTTPWTGLLGFDGAFIIDGERGGSALVAALEKNKKKNGTPGRHLPVQETQVDSLDDQLENSAPDME